MSNEDKDRKDEKPEEEEKQEDHPGYYFCGICGWVPISVFPHCH